MSEKVQNDNRLRIFLDNNVWDFLFENEINICKEFPVDKFQVCISKEVEFESDAIKGAAIKGADKEGLIAFIKKARKECVGVVSVFGFFDERHSDDKQRVSGFGSLFDDKEGGRFWTLEESEFQKQLKERFRENTKSEKHDLYKQEADIQLAVESMSSVVLSLDEKVSKNKNKKKDPLNVAFDRGFNVVFLTEFKEGSLREFVLKKLGEIEKSRNA